MNANVNIVKSHHEKLVHLKNAIFAGDFIYIFGAPSVGKTTIAKEFLGSYNDVMSIYINCNSMTSTSKIYSFILKDLSSKLKYRKALKLDKLIGVGEFIKLYSKLERESHKEGFIRVYVVLDQVDLLYKTSMMDAVVALAAVDNLHLFFCSCDSSDIFLNSISSDVVRNRISDKLMVIQLPIWTKSDIIDTICEQMPAKFQTLYRKFVANIVSIVYSSTTKSFVEIRNWCQTNFEDFIEFYTQMVSEETKLYPEAFEDDYIDEYGTSSLGSQGSANIIASYLHSIEGLKPCEGMSDFTELDQDRKLNFATGMLVVAVFVAANTRPADDKRNFVSFQKRKISRRGQIAKVTKSFSLERLLQIFKGLLVLSNQSGPDYMPGEKAGLKYHKRDFRNSVLSDVSLLEDLKIIEIVTGDGLSPDTTYRMRSVISYTFVERIAQQIGIVIEHLHGIRDV